MTLLLLYNQPAAAIETGTPITAILAYDRSQGIDVPQHGAVGETPDRSDAIPSPRRGARIGAANRSRTIKART